MSPSQPVRYSLQRPGICVLSDTYVKPGGAPPPSPRTRLVGVHPVRAGCSRHAREPASVVDEGVEPRDFSEGPCSCPCPSPAARAQTTVPRLSLGHPLRPVLETFVSRYNVGRAGRAVLPPVSTVCPCIAGRPDGHCRESSEDDSEIECNHMWIFEVFKMFKFIFSCHLGYITLPGQIIPGLAPAWSRLSGSWPGHKTSIHKPQSMHVRNVTVPKSQRRTNLQTLPRQQWSDRAPNMSHAAPRQPRQTLHDLLVRISLLAANAHEAEHLLPREI